MANGEDEYCEEWRQAGDHSAMGNVAKPLKKDTIFQPNGSVRAVPALAGWITCTRYANADGYFCQSPRSRCESNEFHRGVTRRIWI